MSENFYTHQSENIWKTWLLMLSFFVLIISFGWVISLYYNNPSILLFAVIFSIAMNITSYWYSDKIVLSLYKARPATREEFFDLYTVTENLAITAGLPLPALYVIDDNSPNAFATGRNKEHGVVCVTTGLLSMLNRQELEGVIAHELSHIGNRDILLATVVVVLVGFISLASDFFLRSAMWGGGRSNDNNKGGVLVLILAIALSILTPLVAVVIQLAISRKREFLADSSAALLTRYPEGLAGALRKISASPAPLQRASSATAHLFISNPFKGNKVSKLFMTHPPVEERIAALLGKDAV